MKRNNKKQAAPPITIAQPRSDYGFVNLSTYTSPEIKEVANKDWVAYGEDNNYFQFLIDRYNGSPTNNAAVNGISQAIYGKGLGATDANRKPEQYAQMISLLHKDCVRKVSYDLKLMGQAAIQVIYSKDRKKIAQLEHFPIETLRAEKANDDGEIPAYYYFKDWTEIKPSDKPLRIPAYGKSKEKIEMYYIKPYRAGFYYYSPVEIKTASLLMDNTVIRPFQELLIDCFDQLLAYNDISLNLYFITLQPLEFTEVDDDIQDREEIEEETGYKMSKQIDGKVAYETIKEAEVAAEQMGCKGHHEHEVEGETYYMPCESHEELKAPCWDGYEQIGMKMKNGKKVPNCVPLESEEKDLSSELSELLSLGKDEDELLNSYDLIDVSEVDYEKDDEFDTKITELNEPSLLSKITHLVKTGKPYPKKESEQDGTTKQDEKLKFLVRYQYAPLKMQGDSRKFCKAMVRAKKVYRKEDIVRMGKQEVNPGFGVGGAATYSIWLYKGGARCHHKWFRKTYMLTDGKKGKKEITRSRGSR